MAIYWRTEPTHRPEIDYDSRGTFEGALPAGIYCEDEKTRVTLLKGASETGKSIGVDLASVFGCTIAGTPVYVATPEQLAALKAMPARTPEDVRAEQEAMWEAANKSVWSEIAAIDGMTGGLPPKRASRPAPLVPPTRHPFNGANRAARRASAAMTRRQA